MAIRNSFGYVEKVVDLGDWDMDTDASTAVAHGLSATEWKTIVGFVLIIRNDADTTYYDGFNGSTGKEAYISTIDSTNINIFRNVAGTFDDPAFTTTPYNRGRIAFKYIPD